METGAPRSDEGRNIVMPASDAPVAIELTAVGAVNYAMQQNDVAVISQLRIANRSDDALQDLRVRIRSEPEFSEAWERHITTIAPQSACDLGVLDLPLSHNFLAGLAESVSGLLRVEVLQQDRPLAALARPVRVLAYDEWGGLAIAPEVLAAFVTPNHPAVDALLADASALLGRETGDPSLSGYQRRDPARVVAIAAAIYAALQARGIRYANPPASFEAYGQKIRLPDRIFEHSLATCLDLSVLAASCLEQSGLHPLIMVMPGHAFVGVWLTEESFADAVSDDVLRIRKRVELGEICALEATGVTAASGIPFSRAVSAGNQHLANDGQTFCVLDVHRARYAGVRPLPLRHSTQGGGVPDLADDGGAEPGLSIPDLPTPAAPPEPGEASAAETPASRLDRWKRRLLDLTLHNRLLNFRETKKSLRILCPDLASLEDALAQGTRFRIHPRLRDLDDSQPRDAEVHRQRTGDDALNQLLHGEFQEGRLRADATEVDLARRLLEIYREARTSLEESGANTLYLALGFLAWYENGSSNQRRMAPIVLIPLEVERHSVQEGFSITRGDDEVMVNTTLLELLSHDFGLQIPGMDPVPQDEHGVDVPGILTTFRQAVKRIDRWEVVDDAYIGLFSFSKFLMWRDLQVRSEDLQRSKVVSHLINTPHQPYADEAPFPEAEQLDDTHRPDATFCPLSADSSQLAAVYAAASGRSFVLHGPPGTGKSQTITNLIAHALASGKTVLFVSEKMAALSVVQRRLEQCGLGPFCLELHSSKSRKQEVLRQLERSLQRTSAHTSEDWLREAARIAELRRELNAYVRALHLPRATGESVFAGLSRLIGLREARRLDLGWEPETTIDRDALEGLRQVVRRMQHAGEECGHPSASVWAPAGCDSWSASWRNDVERSVQQLQSACTALTASVREVGPLLGMGGGPWNAQELTLVGRVATALLSSPTAATNMVLATDWEVVNCAVTDWITHGQRRDTLRTSLYKRYTEQVLQLDLPALTEMLRRAQAAWFVPRLVAEWQVGRTLGGVAQPGCRPPKGQLKADLEEATALRTEEEHLAECSDRARELLGLLWRDGEANWEDVATARDWTAALRSLAAAAAGTDVARAAALRQHWANLVGEGRDQLRPEEPIGVALSRYMELRAAFAAPGSAVTSLLSLDAASAWQVPGTEGALEAVAARTAQWLEHLADLRAWCFWRGIRLEAVDQHLQALVQAYEQDGLPSADLMRTFERSFYQWWVEAMVDAEPVLRGFFSREFERMIQEFQEVDSRYLSLTQSEIQARVAARLPQPTEQVSENSETGILRRQLQRQRGHMPIRALFQRIPNLLPRLKPCLLMSPISVAQYLDPAYPPFDLIVFDEASQIPVWDAVGAIARGEEAVIVGDPKQLPPTSFFSRSDEQDLGDDDVVEDLESILDDCIAAQLPDLHLLWHYRSQHESLIAFSNYSYYDNRLLTFPSPSQEPRVSIRYVEGQYDKGRSRTNRTEAEAVVAEVLRRLRDPQLSQLSIGVVTFSLAQQTLVEDLLDEARQTSPEIEPYFATGSAPHAEPVFVKNLENVQGDERDVILFSVCYGPDGAGRVSMNLGPLNRDGGHRRLNVAITRARREVTVFSTLRPDQIDLARTRARGVADLKCFLDYAERGPVAIAERRHTDSDALWESPFEQQVCEALRERGHVVHPQVGCSGYRIDLAVVDPDRPGRYMLGIECDGANYHRAKTARDRDRLREAVLRGLGWQLHRVWSTDWWEKPKEELERIEAAIEAARRRVEPAAAVLPVGPLQAQPTIAPPVRQESGPTPAPKQRPPSYVPYQTSRLRGGLDAFYDPASTTAVRRVLEDVVAQEGPISLSLAMQRVAECWGISRVAHRIQERISAVAKTAQITRQRHGNHIFLWPASQSPDEYQSFRVPGPDELSRRKAEDIPPEEIASGALCVLNGQVSLPLTDLVRETARLFGFQRVGQSVESYMRAGVEVLLQRGDAVEQGEMIVHRQ
jgi:very-short-patch-repair endonuclease